MTAELDSFETALLAELRAIVTVRAGEASPAPGRPRKTTTTSTRMRRRWLLAPVGVAAAAVAALAVLPGLGPQPAYAVTVDGSGEVHVRVHRLEDASGLQAALEAQGIAADVDYLAPDTQCAPGRYVEAASRPGDFHFSAGAGYGYSIDLDPGVMGAGETLVIAASRISPSGDPDGDGISDNGGSWVSVGIAAGGVAPCDRIPLELPAAR